MITKYAVFMDLAAENCGFRLKSAVFIKIRSFQSKSVDSMAKRKTTCLKKVTLIFDDWLGDLELRQGSFTRANHAKSIEAFNHLCQRGLEKSPMFVLSVDSFEYGLTRGCCPNTARSVSPVEAHIFGVRGSYKGRIQFRKDGVGRLALRFTQG